MGRKLILFLSFSFAIYITNSAFSQNLGQKLSFWQEGFDIKAYKKCQSKLNSCPRNGPLRDKNCTDNVLDTYKACTQLSNLSNVFDFPANAITLKPYKKFTLVKLNYIADGQTESYVITPQGMLYNSNVDVRKINKQLEDEFNGCEFMISNWGDWKVITKNKQYQFQILQKITNACLACPVLLWADVSYYFDQDGKLIKTTASQTQKPKSYH